MSISLIMNPDSSSYSSATGDSIRTAYTNTWMIVLLTTCVILFLYIISSNYYYNRTTTNTNSAGNIHPLPSFTKQTLLTSHQRSKQTTVDNTTHNNNTNNNNQIPKHALSVVIPAYNEQDRLPTMLSSVLDCLFMQGSTSTSTATTEKSNIIFNLIQDAISSMNQVTHANHLCTTNNIDNNNNNNIDNNNENENENENNIVPYIPNSIQIIIVNDGSNDHTTSTLTSFLQPYQTILSSNNSNSNSNSNSNRITIDIVHLARNSGKGCAVQIGMLHTNSILNLMVDADGATDFYNGLVNLLTQLVQYNRNIVLSKMNTTTTTTTTTNQNINTNNINDIPSTIHHHHFCHVLFGSRAHLVQTTISNRSISRTILMRAFHFLVKTICQNYSIQDTQCGFKLFTHVLIPPIFYNLHLRRWAFDIEIVYILQHVLLQQQKPLLCNYNTTTSSSSFSYNNNNNNNNNKSTSSYNTSSFIDIIEVPVPWKEIAGSKLDTSKWNLILSSLGMLRDMIRVRIYYSLSIWRLLSTIPPSELESSSLSQMSTSWHDDFISSPFLIYKPTHNLSHDE